MARAHHSGVRGIVVPGVDPATWGRLRALAAEFGWSYAVGTHPHALARGRAVPSEPGTAVAIGECGLDGRIDVPMAEQVEVLNAHLALAREASLPVLLHCVQAHEALLATLRAWAPLRGVMHGYSGGEARVAEYVRLGLHLSFGGPLTWPSARRPVAAMARVPLERLLAESDAPDQAPFPHRGRSEPAMLPLVVAAMERIRGQPLAQLLVDNAVNLGLWALEVRAS